MKQTTKFIALALISCNGNPSSTSPKIEDKSEAENIILYNNMLVKYANMADSRMNQVVRDLKYLSSSVENKSPKK